MFGKNTEKPELNHALAIKTVCPTQPVFRGKFDE